jgi:hypothetical protein
MGLSNPDRMPIGNGRAGEDLDDAPEVTRDELVQRHDDEQLRASQMRPLVREFTWELHGGTPHSEPLSPDEMAEQLREARGGLKDGNAQESIPPLSVTPQDIEGALDWLAPLHGCTMSLFLYQEGASEALKRLTAEEAQQAVHHRTNCGLELIGILRQRGIIHPDKRLGWHQKGTPAAIMRALRMKLRDLQQSI